MQKIKSALLSYGMSGKVFHAPFLNIHPEFELVGAWERTNKLIETDYPSTKSYQTLDALLEDDINLVVVNTPTATHFEYAKKALESGKHVLVEKAFTTTVAEAIALDQLAKSKNLKLAVFQNRRWDSDFKTVQKIISQDILGELVEAEFHFDRYNPILSPKLHKETNNPGAGILKDLGSHIIDQALCLFGLPQAVFADIRTTREHSLVDDYFDILLYYPDFRVRLKGGFFIRKPNPAYVIHGKKGSFLKPRGDIQEDELKLGKKPNLENWGTESLSNQGLLNTEMKGEIVMKKIQTEQGNYYDFFESLYQSISNHKSEPVSAQDGINVMRVIESSISSNELKKVIYL